MTNPFMKEPQTPVLIKEEEMQGVVVAKDEDIHAEIQAQKMEIVQDPAKNPFVAKFT